MNQQNRTHKTQMTRERFSQLLDAYGGDAKRWPIEERAAALLLVEQSEEARRLQQSALALDSLLDSVQISQPSTKLRQRILAKAHHHTEQVQDAWQWFIQWLIGTTPREHILRPAFALVIPLLLGIVIGFNLASLPEDENRWVEEEINLLALGHKE
ncbi:MAG: hypothetical protein DRR08_04495 [Candidatus Parabeggiatoa sp. nov. 2]|nr:MAG: hypothetical protein B6247_10635 [Beggiatoa sp. 4572_84]RKZ63031.1 MAG: hypothetical protein DRR08_04495 [Gammaproteobacteria bacterium]